MEANEVKAGTRCECQADHEGHHVGPLFRECRDGRGRRRDAVRMVTVGAGSTDSSGHKAVLVDVPMCAACAEWHEKGGAL
jgi:hypothetical protein